MYFSIINASDLMESGETTIEIFIDTNKGISRVFVKYKNRKSWEDENQCRD